jgi:hypothetical protein
MLFALFCAGVPHAKKTTPFVRTFDTVSMTFCISSSQPLPECEFASPLRTVRHVLIRSTPRSAHGVRSPLLLGGGW